MADPIQTPAPKNGATTQTQQPATATQTNATPTIEEREAALAKRENAYKAEVTKFTASKGGLGAKLSEHAAFKKENDELKKYRAAREEEDASFTLNPEPFLKKRLGDDYYDKLMHFRINGVPPAQLLAAEVKNIETKFAKQLEERDAQAKTAQEQALQAEEKEARADHAAGCTSFFASNVANFPLLETYGDPERIGRSLSAFIEQEFVKDGKLMTPQEACEKLEAAEYARLEKAAGAEKYRPKLQEKWKAATVTTSSSGAQGTQQPSSTRRTLGNHLTASTSAPPARRTDAEREAAATAVFNSVRSRNG